MKKNPFAKVSFKTPVVATELARGIGSERFVAGNGEVNASSKKDLMLQIASFLTEASRTGAVTEAEANTRLAISASAKRLEDAEKHQKAVTAAFASKDAHAELGEVMAEELYQAANREGFMRRFLARQELKQGQHPQVRMRMKDATAVVATSPVQVQSQIIRDNLYTPPEFYINARPFIEQREIEQSLGDVLEEKYLEGLEATMVAEDRIWRNLALQSTGLANPLTLFSGTMTAGGLMTLRNQVGRWNIPVTAWLIANDVWTDIVSDTSFQQVIDPVSKHELLLTGMLGQIFGMSIYSDAYRHPQHKVLDQGEMYVVGDAINHGQYTDRGGVNSQPIDGSIEKIPGRGWWLSETVSMVIANARSIARGIRQ